MSYEKYGSYELIKRLATGGMAQIYLARQHGVEGFEKLQVVKRILPHLAENEDFVRMFLDEARIAARLNHPNIVQIFNLGAQNHSYFIAMEYIHGEDVRRLWKKWKGGQKERPLPPSAACRIIMEACGGLDYAHKKTDANGKPLGIVHRDISPQNLLVTFEGGVKVVDFGIAKAVDQGTVTRSGVLKGKYSYMSPEQAAGKKIDARSDIFSLGIVLYELLTGTRLFKRANDIQTLNAVTDCKVTPPSKVNRELPSTVDAAVLRALAKNPAERYQEAAGLQAALEQWLLNEQIPSSSAHLAAFMEELYPGRRDLAGRALVDGAEADAKRDDDRSPRSRLSAEVRDDSEPRNAVSRSAVTRVSREGSGGRQRENAPEPRIIDARTPEVRASHERNERVRSLDLLIPAPPPLEHEPDPTESDSEAVNSEETLRPLERRRASVLPWVVAALIVGLAVWALSTVKRAPRPKPFAVLRIATEPEGASVTFNGVPLTTLTPCTLPPVPSGSYTLALSKRGYLGYRTTLEVPKTGSVNIPKVVLTPELEVQAPDAGAPAALVAVVLKSQPPDAEVLVNGLFEGKTPRVVSMPSGSTFEVLLRHDGYRDLEHTVIVGEGPMQTEVLTLARPVPRSPGVGRAPPAPRAIGTVRFAVTPWAHVRCGEYDFGATPFPDQEMSVGSYDCTFRNPDLGTKFQKLEVVQNKVAVVSVKFR